MNRRVVVVPVALLVAVFGGLLWFASATSAPSPPSVPAAAPAKPPEIPLAADLLQSTGKISLLRVHDVGSGYGPASDFIDVEVIVWLSTQPGKAFGFQLRNDAQRAARQGQLDLLRDAFNNNWTVTLNYLIDPGKNNGVIIRTWVTKP